MPWTLRGRDIEHCSCNSICPCFTSALTRRGDGDRCRGFIAFDVEAGEADGVDLAGRRALFIQDAPAMMAEGDWKVGIVVDDGATDAQAEKLAAILTGEAGGPMAGFAPLIGEILGVERAPITIETDGHTHRVQVGELVDAEFQDEIHEGATEPVQLLNTTGVPFGPPVTISPPTKSMIRAFGMEIDNSNRHGTTANFDWRV